MLRTNLFLSIICLFLFASCTESTSDPVITVEEIEEPKTGSINDVLPSDLNTINDMLEKEGFEIVTESDLERLRIARNGKTCLNAQFKGDINKDDVISIDDVLTIYSLIKEYDDTALYPETANGDGRLQVNAEYVGTSPSFWSVAHVGQLVTYDEGTSHNTTYLDAYDAAVIIDLITGECN